MPNINNIHGSSCPNSLVFSFPSDNRALYGAVPIIQEVNVGYRVAVVGATGSVGREMLNILAERQFPADEVVALASRRSLGTQVSFGDKIRKYVISGRSLTEISRVLAMSV